MEQKLNNLFEGLPESLPEEICESLLENKSFHLERIVSHGQRTPEGQWLKSSQGEWVILLSGAAKLSFALDKSELNMSPGDYVHIPANTQHRVEWTDPNTKTVWLALHY